MLQVCRGRYYDTERIDTGHNEIVYNEDLDENCPLCEAKLAIHKLQIEIEDDKNHEWRVGYERGSEVTIHKVLERLEAMKDVDTRPIMEVVSDGRT